MKLKLGREDPFFPLKCIRRPTREKEGEEKNKEGGGELDYLKFRGNYEGHFHYCGNLFLCGSDCASWREVNDTDPRGKLPPAGEIGGPRPTSILQLKSSVMASRQIHFGRPG